MWEHVFVVCEATILHADLDAFYASVEQRDDSGLRGRPVIVGGGVVLAASYEAKAFGIRTAMGGAEARRLCPWAVVVEPRMSAYTEASKAVFEVFDQTTPLVEGLSIDEAFLDVGGLRRVSGTLPRDRGTAATRGRRAGWPADHRRRGQDQVPGQGGERRGQARRPAGGAARRGAGFPPPASGRAPLGRRPGHRSQAAQPRHRHGGRGGPAGRVHAGRDARPGVGRGISTPWPTIAIRGRSRWGGAGTRSGLSTRSAAHPDHPRTSTP